MGDGFKLIRCEACGADISKKAGKCPRCGHPVKRGIDRYFGRIMLALTVFFAVVIWVASQQSGSSNPGSAPTVQAQSISSADGKYRVSIEPGSWDQSRIGRETVIAAVTVIRTSGYVCDSINSIRINSKRELKVWCDRGSRGYSMYDHGGRFRMEVLD